MSTFATTAADCAEWLFSALNPPPSGARFVDGSGDEVQGKKLASEMEMEKLWAHSEALVDKIV